MSSNNERYGLLIDYDYCSGCHACEVACKQEHKFPVGQWGIRIAQDGPRKLENGRWEYTYLPVPTSLCDLCEDRVKVGKLPNCVHHCQAGVMVYGKISELAEKVEKGTMVIFSR